jgi:hypothetical protein
LKSTLEYPFYIVKLLVDLGILDLPSYFSFARAIVVVVLSYTTLIGVLLFLAMVAIALKWFKLRLYLRGLNAGFSRSWLHEALFACGQKYNFRSFRNAVLRTSFSIPEPRAGKKTHGHIKEATVRRFIKNKFTEITTECSMNPFDIQPSASDRPVNYLMEVYSDKDLEFENPGYRKDGDNHVAQYIDCDYYRDMNYELNSLPRPTLIYHVRPDTVGANREEYAYTFTDARTLEFRVAGGGTYAHEIWNFNADVITAVSYRSWWESGNIATVYKVDSICPLLVSQRSSTRQRDHEILSLSPIYSTDSLLLYLFMSLIMSMRTLTRLDVCQTTKNGYACFEYTQPGLTHALVLTVGRLGETAGLTVPRHVFDTAMAHSRTSEGYGRTSYLFSQHFSKDECSIILDFVMHGMCEDFRPAYARVPAPSHYQFANEFTEFKRVKPSLISLCRPIISGGLSPMKSMANEACAVMGRVLKIAHKEKNARPDSPEVREFFLSKLVPEAHRTGPKSIENVLESQKAPGQRRIIDQAKDLGYETILIDTFLKAETYTADKIKEPRLISTLPPVSKVEYSRYTLAAAETLKQQPWYAFGRVPRDIAIRVGEICGTSTTKSVIISDFSRFDGRVSSVMRDIEKEFMTRLFAKDYHPELLLLMADQQSRIARTTNGIFYNTYWTRLSGSPETSLFNSLANAYISFNALAKTYPLEEAWNKLGIYGGDDGLTPDLDSQIFRDVAEEFGCKSTTEVVTPYTGRVKFLARIYSPNVWSGSPNSCCDVPRTLSKFHFTVNLNGSSPARRFMEKIVALNLSDSNTPIIREFVAKFIQLAKDSKDEVIRNTISQRFDVEAIRRSGLSYNAQFANEAQYVNDGEPWMIDYLAECFGHVRVDFRKWNTFITTKHTNVEHAMETVPTVVELPMPESDYPVLLYNESGDVLELNNNSSYRAAVPPVTGDKRSPTNFTRRGHTAEVKQSDVPVVLPVDPAADANPVRTHRQSKDRVPNVQDRMGKTNEKSRNGQSRRSPLDRKPSGKHLANRDEKRNAARTPRKDRKKTSGSVHNKKQKPDADANKRHRPEPDNKIPVKK